MFGVLTTDHYRPRLSGGRALDVIRAAANSFQPNASRIQTQGRPYTPSGISFAVQQSEQSRLTNLSQQW